MMRKLFLDFCLRRFSAAVGSGGALEFSGVVVELNRSEFIGNRAGDGGLAISSLGVLESINHTLFESNTEYCPPGQYGYNTGEFDDEVAIVQYP